MKLLETKIIKIGDKEYPTKLTARAMIGYETLTGHPITVLKTIEDRTYLFYVCLKAGGTDITYDAFLDLIDNCPAVIGEFFDLFTGDEPEKKQKTR